MKKMTVIGFCSAFFVFCLINHALAVTSIGGIWAGSAKKVTNSGCATVSVSVQLTQCSFNNVLSRLVRGTAKIGTITLNIVGRINDDNTVLLQGTEINLVTSLSAKFIIMRGNYIAPADGAKAKITVNQLAFMQASAVIDPEELTLDTINFNTNEMYDIFTITKK